MVDVVHWVVEQLHSFASSYVATKLHDESAHSGRTNRSAMIVASYERVVPKVHKDRPMDRELTVSHPNR